MERSVKNHNLDVTLFERWVIDVLKNTPSSGARVTVPSHGMYASTWAARHERVVGMIRLLRTHLMRSPGSGGRAPKTR